jgi:hypothetical protein
MSGTGRRQTVWRQAVRGHNCLLDRGNEIVEQV